MSSPIIFADIETSSACPIQHGAWAYSEHPSTIVYCVVFGVWLPEKERLIRKDWTPESGALDTGIRKLIEKGTPVVAFNVQFERAIWTNILTPRHGWPEVPSEAWGDAQADCVAFNLPPSLEGAGEALGCNVQKDTEGAAIMKKMAKAVPDEDGGWSYDRDPSRVKRLIEYCWIDVATTAEIYQKVPRMHLFEYATWQVDQDINVRGVYLDNDFAAKCLEIAEAQKVVLNEKISKVSGGEVPSGTSVPKLKKWLKERGVELPVVVRQTKKGKTKSESLSSAAVGDLLKQDDLDPAAREVLVARQETGKLTSLAKLKRVSQMVGSDGRLRGAFRFHGAHTGRWSSSGFQLHNLPKPKDHWDIFVAAIEDPDDDLTIYTAEPLSAMSQCLRATVCAPPGRELLAADYSAIEARVVAWLAGQEDILEVFERGEDVYVYAAEQAGSDNRQLGKVLTLALGYGMGALKFHGQAAAYGVPMSLKEANDQKKGWRERNTAIVSFWHQIENAVREAIENPKTVVNVGPHIRCMVKGSSLRIGLPSGRAIYYHRPHFQRVKRRMEIVNDEGEIEIKEMQMEEIRFWKPSNGRAGMEVESTYGGKLTENVTQAVARDLLAAAMVRLKREEYEIVAHVHDSIATEVAEGEGDLSEFERLMAVNPPWAQGLPMEVEGYRGPRFKG